MLENRRKRRRRALLDQQTAEAAGPLAECHQWLGRPGEARDDIAVVMMVKDEEDIIFENLAWHCRLGIRRFIVMDDSSTDATLQGIAQARENCPEAEILVVEGASPAFYQDRKTTGLALMAEKLWPSVRWIFPVDTDEFICAREDLATSLASLDRIGVDTVYIPYFNSNELADGSPSDQTVPFHRRQTYHKPRVEDFKAAFRAGGVVKVHMGNHDVDKRLLGQRLGNGLHAGLVYRHFPARSIEHLRKKVVNGGKALAATNYPQHFGWHWRTWYASYLTEGDAALHAIYDSMRIPPTDAVHAPFPLDELLSLPK